MSAYLYILLLENNSYYTGSTIDLESRLNQHWAGEGANYTKKFKPIKLVFIQEFPDIETAFEREHQVKGWTRVKKKALIDSDFNKLVELSQNYKDRFG